MSTTQSIAEFLEQRRESLSRDERFRANLSDSQSRALVGLRQLEVYVSMPVAAWLEDVFEEAELQELAASDMFDNIRSCADYIDAAIESGAGDAHLWEAWRATRDLIESFSKSENDVDFPRKAITLLAASIALRAFFESHASDNPELRKAPLAPDGNRIASAFFERVKAKAAAIPVNWNAPVCEVIEQLPSSLRREGWI